MENYCLLINHLKMQHSTFSLLICTFIVFFISCGTTANKTSSVIEESKPMSFNEEIEAFREGKKQDFKENDHAPLKGKEIEFMRFFDPDPYYSVIAEVKRIENAESITITTSAGEKRQYIPYATLDFNLGEEAFQLIIHTSTMFLKTEKYKDLLFLMYNDETNGEETYGGGRYLELSKQDIKDGKVVLDFNKSYHPYCHYSSGYSCPIPPKENYLATKILAGEKNYAGEYKGEH